MGSLDDHMEYEDPLHDALLAARETMNVPDLAGAWLEILAEYGSLSFVSSTEIAHKGKPEEPEALLEAAIRSAQWKAERSKLEAEKVERDLGNMARERLLPDEKTLEKVARYEAHTFPEDSTRLCTNLKPCRRDELAAPLP